MLWPRPRAQAHALPPAFMLLAWVVLCIASCLPKHGQEQVRAGRGLAIGEAPQPIVEGPFRLLFGGPKGDSPAETEVTLAYSRPVRAIGLEDDERQLAPPAAVVRADDGAPVAGAWHWFGQSTAVFTPKERFRLATSYRVEPRASLVSRDGSALAPTTPFTFTTERPKLKSVSYGYEEEKNRHLVTLQFNQPIAPAAAKKAIRIEGRGAAPATPKAIPFTVVETASSATLTLDADVAVARLEEIKVIAATTLRGEEGPLGPVAEETLPLDDVGPLEVQLACIPPGRADNEVSPNEPEVTKTTAKGATKKKCDLERGSIEARFTKPVDGKDLPRYVGVAPPAKADLGPLKDMNYSTSSIDLGQLVDAEPGKTYRVTIKAGLRASDKERLTGDRVIDFEVADRSPALTWRDASGLPTVVESARAAIPMRMVSTNVQAFESTYAPIDERALVELLFPPAPSDEDSANAPAGAAAPPRDDVAWLKKLPKSVTKRVDVAAPKKNTPTLSIVDVASERAQGAPGMIALGTHVLDPSSKVPDDLHVLSITDLGVTVKWSPHGALVWVTRLSNAEVVSGATISLQRIWRGVKPTMQEAFTTTTDRDGLATIPSQVVATFLRAAPDADDALKKRSIAEPLLIVKHGADSTFARLPELDPRLLTAMGDIFVERGLYRPGESVLLKGYYRIPSPTGLATAAGKTAYVEAVDSSDRVFHSATVALDAFGAFSLEIPIPKTAQLGFAFVRSRLGRANDTAPRRGPGRLRYFRHDAWSAQDRFTIDEFRTPEMKLEASSDRPSYLRGDKAVVEAIGTYLLGAPVTGVPVSVEVSRRSTTFAPPGLERYGTTIDRVLANEGEDRNTETIATLDPKLDAKGHVTIPFPLLPADPPKTSKAPPPAPAWSRLPDAYTFNFAIEDVSRAFAVGQSVTFLAHPSDTYLGVRALPPTEDGGPIIAGKTFRAELVAASVDGQRQGGVRTRIELFRHANQKEKPVKTGQSCTLSTDAAKVATCVLAIAEDGTHLLLATATDARGHAIAASSSFYVAPKNTKPPPPPPPPPPVAPPLPELSFEDACAQRELSDSPLLLDRPEARTSYTVGQRALACLRSRRAKSSRGLFTMEREGVLRVDPPTLLSHKGKLVSIPITNALAPNVFVSLHAVEGRSSPFVRADSVGGDSGFPTTTSSTERFAVSAPASKLTVTIEPQDKEYRPGGDVVLHLNVKDGDGRPAPSQVTVWAIDEGIDLLVPKSIPTPHATFSEERSSDVRDLDTRENIFFEHALHSHQTKSPSLRAGATTTSPGRLVGRSMFRPTALFLPNVVTRADGTATVKAKLPDNLTTWKVFAVAATTGASFGGGETSFKTNKPLMLRPALPRFLRTGDRFDATVVIDSLVKEPRNVTLSIQTRGVLATTGGPTSATVTIPAEGHVPMHFPVTARAVGSGAITFKVDPTPASPSLLGDEVTIDEEVKPIVAIETVVLDGEIPASPSTDAKVRTLVNEPLGDLSKARADVGGFDYRLSTTPLVGLAESMQDLIEYPYGCTEQLTSRLVPLIRLRALAQKLGVTLPSNVDASVRSSLSSLLAHQRDDGGFGFWRGSEKSEPWLTILALGALHTADRQGYVVSPAAMSRARAWLDKPTERNTDPKATTYGDPPTNKPIKLDPGSRAMLEDLYVSLGTPRLTELRALAGDRDLPLFGQALVAHALATVDRDLAKQMLDRIASQAHLSGAQASFKDETSLLQRQSLSSDARTTAMALRAFVVVDPKHPLVPKLVRGLLSMRRDGRWPTTQASAWALAALDDSAVLFGPKPGSSGASLAELVFNGQTIAKTSFTGASEGEARSGTIAMSRLLAAPGAPIGFASDGGRTLFFEGALRYARSDPPKTPLEHGLGIARSMRLLRGAGEASSSSPTTMFHVGDYVIVDVVVTTAIARDLVVVDDPIPSGFEAVNQSFANNDRRAILDDPASYLVTHRELRDDRVVSFFDTLPAGVHATRYLLRAIAPGQFTAPAAKAECMYAPDTFGRTATTLVETR